MTFALMRAWIARRHWGWQIPLFVGYAALWLVWQTMGVLYGLFMLVLGSFFGRRHSTAWNIKVILGVLLALLLVFVAVVAEQLLGQLIFTIILGYFLYKGGRIAIKNRW